MRRRLAAVFSLDMVGYSSLMEVDEAVTLARLESARTQTIAPAIARHHGRVVKGTGDGLLVEFSSAVDAVECAADIQQRMAERETGIPFEQRIQFRIGINVGDIVDHDRDIFGDGVNVAVRIQSLAGAGEILLSGSVYEQVQNKVGIEFADIGFHEVKNLQRSVHVYRVLATPVAGETAPATKDRQYVRLGLVAVIAIATVAVVMALWKILPGPSAGGQTPSIAVLPFVDMSPEGDQEYFSDGISEELLNLLGKIPELRVAARTSSFSFKDRSLEVPEIGRRLNVAHVLEGSVRKADDQVRVTVQLIRADDGFHIWSHTWNRTLDDIFRIQDEIAADVVAQLKVTLLGATPRIEQTDTEAYALFLQARQASRQHTEEGLRRSVALYERALAIDPEYAPAWAGLADSYALQTGAFLLPFDEGYLLAREAAERALALDPTSAEARAYLGYIAMHYDGDLAAAAAQYEEALRLEPANPDIVSMAARLARNLGQLDQPIELMRYVVSRDPLNPASHVALGSEYRRAGRLDESIASLQTALSLSPGHAGAEYAIGVALLLKGEPEAALEANQRESAEWYRLTGITMAYHDLGRPRESDGALAELIDKYERGWAYQIAYVEAYRGDVDAAFEWLSRAAEYGDPGLAEIPTQGLFANLWNDPRWIPFLESIGKSPEQLAAIDFEVRRPAS
jgi:TolB-like protein/class 3 adenylate cyclase/Tfp pilus assembly protein PilF